MKTTFQLKSSGERNWTSPLHWNVKCATVTLTPLIRVLKLWAGPMIRTSSSHLVGECATITPIPLIKNKDENTPYCEPAFERLLSSFRFHFLLRSTDSMWMILDYQSLSYVLLSLYLFSSTLPSRFTLAMLETFRKNHRPLAEVSWQGTTPYYVHTFRP